MNPDKRISADEALADPWIKKYTLKDTQDIPVI